MRYRKFGLQYATVNDELLSEYKKRFPQMKADVHIITYLIESRLIFRPVQNVDDMEEAKKYVQNMFYSDLGEWVNSQLREDIIRDISICKNCAALGANSFCPILGAFVNPYQKGCHNMQ